jgi:hypothetical protein
MDWNPQGTRKRGRPRTTWKRVREGELQTSGNSWKGAKGLVWDRTKLRTGPVFHIRTKWENVYEDCHESNMLNLLN